jgi:protein involved in polysaccharide export with SLBB domain
LILPKGNGSLGPQVSVQLYQSRARIFSIFGQVGGPGEYNIIGTDFRVLDALALAHDIAGGSQPGMDYLYVIRPIKGAAVIPPKSETQPATTGPASTNPLNTIDRINRPSGAAPAPRGDEVTSFVRELPRSIATLSDNPALLAQANLLDDAISGNPGAPAATRAAAPATPTAATMPAGTTAPAMPPSTRAGLSYVDGKWVDVIRPGDYINVPNIEPGEFYLLGHVGRAGVYSITGRKVTLKQAVAAAGGLDQVAVPRRCDLIRRVGNTEVTVQVDLQRIFDGEQPDIFLKANDLVNVGTDAIAPFLAVTRNAYRGSYGWGFVYDRNLYNPSTNNNTNSNVIP